MTITEANDVAILLRLLGTAEPVDVDRVVAAASALEVRVYKALAAGPRVDPDVVRDMATHQAREHGPVGGLS
ncbi:MAG: hypothetical protein EPO65_00500 [Dehalococcoidia bacterium]|nr:MAG: hypothetical protein EPO65_00500 [Dehalococcoidia bacterium]